MAIVMTRRIPTKADVELLLREVGIPSPGDVIQYARLEAVLRIDRRAQAPRWMSVIGAWKKRLYHGHNLDLEAIPNVGYEVNDNRKRAGHAVRLLHRSKEKLQKSGDLAARTSRDGLDPKMARGLEHTQMIAATALLSMATAAKELDYTSTKVKRLPPA